MHTRIYIVAVCLCLVVVVCFDLSDSTEQDAHSNQRTSAAAATGRQICFAAAALDPATGKRCGCFPRILVACFHDDGERRAERNFNLELRIVKALHSSNSSGR